MAELTKKIIKESVVEVLEPFAKSVQTDLQSLRTELKQDIKELHYEVKEMKESSSELFAKLDKFIVIYEKQEQELAVLGAQVRRLEERIAKLENKKI